MRVAGLLVVLGAIAAALGGQVPASTPSTASSPTDVPRSEHRGAPGEAGGPPILRSKHRGPPGENGGAAPNGRLGAPGGIGGAAPDGRLGALGEADGAVPDGTTVFDDGIPGVAKLDPGLLGALRGAAAEAAGDGVRFSVDSGWRSRAYQQQLLDEAVVKYGSREEAALWVASPDRSAHVTGDAVDLGPSAATAWLGRHGSEHGLCPVYGNEPWHFELRPEAVKRGCPPVYADPTEDPRLGG